MQLDKKVVQDISTIEKYISYIKGVLIIMLKDLETQLEDQRLERRVLVLVKEFIEYRLLWERFKLKDKDKPRVNLKHLAYYILAQIVYIDNQCSIYKALKIKAKRYLVRIYQILDKRKYRNAKYIYGQHLVDISKLQELII